MKLAKSSPNKIFSKMLHFVFRGPYWKKYVKELNKNITQDSGRSEVQLEMEQVSSDTKS